MDRRIFVMESGINVFGEKVHLLLSVSKNDNVSTNYICINEKPEVVFNQCTCTFPERNGGNNRKLQLIGTNREINPEFRS